MDYCVPDFEMDEDYSILTSSSGLTRSKKSSIPEEEIMELLWQNGQVVLQSQNQRSVVKRSQIVDAVIPAEQSAAAAREIRTSEEESTTHVFMQEDEMASWLHYPMDYSSFDGRDLYTDLIYPAPCAPVTTPTQDARTADLRIPPPSAETAAAATRMPIPPPRRLDVECSERLQNLVHFSRPEGRTEQGPSSSHKAAARESTVVDSCETPAAAGPESMASHVTGSTVQVSGANVGCSTAAACGGRETGTYELTSSPTGSGASASASEEPVPKPPPPQTEDRKRKGREPDDECPSEDVEFESPDAKKQTRGSTSAKKSRAAEVHNLSERRRRDRINEKMKALQELIPHCNKSDKASMLDDAIEYLKSLQLQVQMMSMGCSMVPMMFPGVQQYMPPMGMAMGMGMAMEMGMSRPMLPFPSVLAGSAMPTPAAAAHLGPRFHVPAFHLPHVPVPDPTSQSDPIPNSLNSQNPNQPRMLNFPSPYQQYLGLQQTQLPPPQNQAMMQPSTSKSSRSRDVANHENLQSG